MFGTIVTSLPNLKVNTCSYHMLTFDTERLAVLYFLMKHELVIGCCYILRESVKDLVIINTCISIEFELPTTTKSSHGK
jgi:hypothetical protein